MEFYNYNKIIKKLKLDNLSEKEKINKLRDSLNEQYDGLTRFYNYYLKLIEDYGEDDKFKKDIKKIDKLTVKNSNDYLEAIEEITNIANLIANETIELNSKIYERDKKKKKKSNISKFLFFTWLFNNKKEKKIKDDESYLFEETELEDDDFHFEDPD